MEKEYEDMIGVLANDTPYCMECAQELFGFDVVTAIFEEGKQGTFFFSIREQDVKTMLFPVCFSCEIPLGYGFVGCC